MFLKGLIGVVDTSAMPLFSLPPYRRFPLAGTFVGVAAADQRFVSTFKAFTG
jgi:hypothetical protein